jgi:hypothetical protein
MERASRLGEEFESIQLFMKCWTFLSGCEVVIERVESSKED